MVASGVIRRFRSAAEARGALLGDRGRLAVDADALPAAVRDRIRETFQADLGAEEVVRRVLDDVRTRGDAALRQYTLAFDRAEVGELRVAQAQIDAAVQRVGEPIMAALEAAAQRIRAFHEHTRRRSWLDHSPAGGALGQLIRPLERVAVYAPGGRAPYPSSVLMAAIPARVAEVKEVVLASPPGGSNHDVSDVLLAAARVANIDAVYRVGGAQAIGGLAYGTESLPRVDKIVGPGNIFVVLAKRMVFGQVGIEALPGPTECLVVADDSANPAWVAADLLAQAEHDPLACSLLITPDVSLAEAVDAEVAEQVQTLPRRAIVEESLANRGGIAETRDLDEAIDLANAFAGEHLCLAVRDPWTWLGKVRHAGGVFLGELNAEAIGDYTAGPSHIMPTGGTARFSSPVNVDDFLKVISVFGLGPDDLREAGPPAVILARAESLEAHARAVECRLVALGEGPDAAPPLPLGEGRGEGYLAGRGLLLGLARSPHPRFARPLPEGEVERWSSALLGFGRDRVRQKPQPRPGLCLTQDHHAVAGLQRVQPGCFAI
ncbi:MAG: histidinol dehydrogenase [Chloroflexi bacterium]|nr:histidinol dehydrogenase [Chloroflexota bacterium]